MTFSDSFQNLPGSRTSKTRHCRGVYRLCLLWFGIFIIYWLLLLLICGKKSTIHCDKLNYTLVDIPILGKFGGWPISHLVMFYGIGLLFPDCMLLAMTIGVLWEIIEWNVGRSDLLPRLMDSPNKSNKNMIYGEFWVVGTLQDALYNFIGFVAGMLTTRYFLNGKPPKVPWLSADSSTEEKIVT